MYHAFVRRQLIKGFERLCLEKYEAMLKGFPSTFKLYFTGYPASGKTTYSLAETMLLYGKIFRAYPDLKFEVKDVLVAGGPRNTRVAVEWTCHATQPHFSNAGVHIFHIRWGKVVALQIYCDTQAAIEAYETHHRQAQPVSHNVN